MKLDITRSDRELVLRLLEAHSRELLHEIAKSDSRAFRDGLQQELARVELLQRRVSNAPEDVDQPAL